MILDRMFRISWTKYIYYNYLSRKVVRNGSGRIIPYKNSVIVLGKGARIVLHEGNMYVNVNRPKGSKCEAYILLRDNAVLEVHKNSQLCYGSTIEIHEGGKIEIGSAYFNSESVILAEKSISIGEDTMFARQVYIYDSDHHSFLNEQGEKINAQKDVIIGNHVWVGMKSCLLKGTKIGDGAVVAAYSLVGGKVKGGTMVQGNPARAYAEVRWSV